MENLVFNEFDFTDKQKNIRYFGETMLNKTLSIFEYENLPETIPEDEAEKIFQMGGYGLGIEYGDDLFITGGGFAPPLTPYNRETKMIVTNPWLPEGARKIYTFDKAYVGDNDEIDSVLIRNDPLMRGIKPIIEKFATFLTEGDLTFDIAMQNLRAVFAIVANNDDEAKSGQAFLDGIAAGKRGVLMSKSLRDAIGVTDMSTGINGYLTQIIEAMQFLKGSFYQEIGLQATFNMKRERLAEHETDVDKDILRPLLDSMLEEREIGWDKFNKLFGTNVKVKFGSSWEKFNEGEDQENDDTPIEINSEDYEENNDGSDANSENPDVTDVSDSGDTVDSDGSGDNSGDQGNETAGTTDEEAVIEDEEKEETENAEGDNNNGDSVDVVVVVGDGSSVSVNVGDDAIPTDEGADIIVDEVAPEETEDVTDKEDTEEKDEDKEDEEEEKEDED